MQSAVINDLRNHTKTESDHNDDTYGFKRPNSVPVVCRFLTISDNVISLPTTRQILRTLSVGVTVVNAGTVTDGLTSGVIR